MTIDQLAKRAVVDHNQQHVAVQNEPEFLDRIHVYSAANGNH